MLCAWIYNGHHLSPTERERLVTGCPAIADTLFKVVVQVATEYGGVYRVLRGDK